jgi:calcineurin-like phosphoesterase family protein
MIVRSEEQMRRYFDRLLHIASAARKELSVCGVALLLCAATIMHAQKQPTSSGTWKFAVSGDSRNCGDIVMPAIAQGVRRDGAEFYWHLGDYRAMSLIDEDYHQIHPTVTLADYQIDAWNDFIQHQLQPFGDLPVFLEVGNHEMVSPMSRSQYLIQFAKWFDTPLLRNQRLADNPDGRLLETYYHWISRGIEFIGMDNSSSDQFDEQQMTWFKKVLHQAGSNRSVRTVVLGMHAALPDSLSTGHSMNDTATQESSGREVYAELLVFQRTTKKNVYVLASHSHFVINNAYAIACRPPNEVLTGWIIGTAGAVRYRLPKELSAATIAKTDVYGYLLATVAPNGKIAFEFRKVNEADVPTEVKDEFSQKQVDFCFDQNKQNYTPVGAACGTAVKPGAK